MKSNHFFSKLISAYKKIFSIRLTSDFLPRRRVCFRNMFLPQAPFIRNSGTILGEPTFLYIPLQNKANRLNEKQKISSARENSLARSHFCDCRVIILAGLTFLHKNTLHGSPNRVKSVRAIRASTRRLDNQSMPEG